LAGDRRVEVRHGLEELQIAQTQHGAAVGDAGPHRRAALRIGVLVRGIRGERKAEARERLGLRKARQEPADMVEEDLARRRHLAVGEAHGGYALAAVSSTSRK